ncbi:MAG TPA: DinB family protein [Longimicrobium sp.]|nr:DinB family protein [Longimicrobium sp.]
MSLSELLLPEYDAEIEITRRVLERVPDAQAEFKPHPRSFPMAHLAQLVARMPGWLPMILTQTEIDFAPPGGSKFPGYSIETTATLLAEFDRNAASGRAALAAASDEDFDVTWTSKRGGVVIETMTRYRMIRGAMLNHLVHHRAQLGVYLRMVDVPVPEMYGPTADEGK